MKGKIKHHLGPALFLLVILLSPAIFYFGYTSSSKVGTLSPKAQIKPTRTIVTSNTPYPTPDPVQFKQDVRELINQHRISKGLKPLRDHILLDKSAELKLQHMAQNYYWTHTSPDGIEPWFFIKEAGYKYKFAGENLGRFYTTPESLVEAWLNSPGHRKNIEDRRYTEDGMAIEFSGYIVQSIVHHFGAP